MKTLVVVAETDALCDIAQYVCRTARAAGLSERRVYQLRLAVDEIATNIITHGYAGMDAPGQLRVSARHHEGRLHILLEDDGRPFDPTDAPQPDISLPPENRPEGGLGVYLARWSVDHVAFEHTHAGNRTHIVIHLDG
jgi:anti-sigma regulatory factor (Ser/Thr protein kinase)